MSKTIVCAALLILSVPLAASANDPDENGDTWVCTCTAPCDGSPASTTVEVCADDDRPGEASSDGANSCARALAGQCHVLGPCTCTCHLTGSDC